MQRSIKNYIIDGSHMQFDSFSFKQLFTLARRKKDMSVLEYETELGEVLDVSPSAVHSWRFGMNGPSDVEMIKKLSDYMGISDYQLLLKDGIKKSEIQISEIQISERQKDSLKRVYDAIIDYLEEFQKSNGFNDYWSELAAQGNVPDYIEFMLYEIAENEQHKVELVLSKEYIELHKLPVYEQLEEYVYDVLCEIYDGKLSYAYRFEAPVENIDGTKEGVTTQEDYAYALKRINEILEVYMG